jgi:tetratricopeptide (TPR) repeat protein
MHGSSLPSEDVENALIARESRKDKEDEQKKRSSDRIESHLLKAVEDSKDAGSKIRAYIELGHFYRTKRRQHDALVSFEHAVSTAEGLEKTDPLYAQALIESGEAHMRLGDFEKALKLLRKAEKTVRPGNEFAETVPRIQERIAWIYRCQGDDAAARDLLKQAKEGAARFGKQTAEYRVALIEEALFAMDRKDSAQVQKLSQEIDSLSTTEGAAFGKVFLRIAARNCRKRGELEQEDFLADKSDFFSTLEKRRPARTANNTEE